MATEVVMPKLGLTMESGTLGAWMVEEGGQVTKGEPLLEVVTDKVTMEVDAQVSGVLRKVFVPAGVEVAVTTIIGIIAGADEDIDKLVAQSAATIPQPEATEPAAAAQPPAPVSPEPAVAPMVGQVAERASDGRSPGREVSGRHRASPKARKMLAAHGLKAEHLQGSGPGGRIVSADVATLVAQQPSTAQASFSPTAAPVAASAFASTVELTRPQQVAAERLTGSSRDIPHIHLSMEVSAIWLKQLREGFKLEGRQVSHNDMILRAVGRALSEFPRLNSVLDGNTVRQFDQVNVGIAVDTPQGLFVPVVPRVSEKGLDEIAADRARLVDAARRGELGPDDMMGGTFTISNLGMFGVSQFTAIINPPQVAILAVGAIEQRVVAQENNALVAQPRMTLTLAADHRVVDGAVGARFLQRLKAILENPGLLG